MKPIVIFGCGDIAQLAYFYFANDSDREVAAFTVDAAYIMDETFCGLPVIAFERLVEDFPPCEFDVFVALSYAKVNAVRRSKFEAVKAAGYVLVSYVSSRATVWPGVEVGENCFILEDNTLQPFARIGNNVTLWSGNHIGHHSSIHDHCFVASHVVVSGGVEIGEQCFVGVNVTLRDHIKIGPRCVLGAGTILLGDAEPDGVYIAQSTDRSRVPSSRLRQI